LRREIIPYNPKLTKITRQHGNEGRGLVRQKKLEELGIIFLRFDDLDVKFLIDKVLKIIEERIDKYAEI
jgi:very-short-patch-repair endonuclease